MNRVNSAAAALFFEDFVITMSSPPTTLTLPPGPAGTVVPASFTEPPRIANIHGPSSVDDVLALGDAVVGAETTGAAEDDVRHLTGLVEIDEHLDAGHALRPVQVAGALVYVLFVRLPPADQIHGRRFQPLVPLSA